MKIKFFSAIMGLFLLTGTLTTACLGGAEEYEIDVDATIHAFGLDSVRGRFYTFTIDQRQGLIYNVDSMPVAADTILKKIVIKTLLYNGYVTSGDTLFKHSTSDTLDLSNTMTSPLKLTVVAYDGVTKKDYSVEVRYHLQEPDSMVWRRQTDKFSQSTANDSLKMVCLDGQLLVYTDYQTMYSMPFDGSMDWSPRILSGLNNRIKIQSFTVWNNAVYAIDLDGNLYQSDHTGVAWNRIRNDGDVIALLTGDMSEHLVALIARDSKRRFAVSDNPTNGWTVGEEAPAAFPNEHISATNFRTATGLTKYMLMGKLLDATAKVNYAWFSFDGLSWADLHTPTAYSLPAWQSPTIIYYANKFYAFGEDFLSFYSSLDGLTWNKVTQLMLFPDVFRQRGAYTTLVDPDQYLWLIWSNNTGKYTDEAWKGRLNKLGFKQP